MTKKWNVMKFSEGKYIPFDAKELAVAELERLANDYLEKQPYKDYVRISIRPCYDVVTGEEVSFTPYIFLKDGVKIKHIPKELRGSVLDGASLERLFKIDMAFCSELKEHFAETMEMVNKFIFERYGTYYKPTLNEVLTIQRVDNGYLLFYWE